MFLTQQTKYLCVGFPEVAEGSALSINSWYLRPQTPTPFFATIANKIGNYLVCATTQGYPNPLFVFFDSTKDHNSSNSSTSSGWDLSKGSIFSNVFTVRFCTPTDNYLFYHPSMMIPSVSSLPLPG
jgi:hypothetical protein